jgi:nitrite reductase (NADH) large subunit
VCAAHLAGAGHRRYVQQATATKLKVTGVDLYSAGDFIGGETAKTWCCAIRAVASTSGWCCRVAGWSVPCSMATSGRPVVFRPDPVRQPVAALRQRLLFGQAQCEALAA